MTDSQFDEAMKRLQHGEKDPLKDIYNDYIGYVYSIMYSIVASKENAEDLTTDFFLKLWENADKYHPGTGHKAWMTRIAHNMAIDFLRKYKREILTDDSGETSDTESGGDTPGGGLQMVDTGSPVEDEVLSNITMQKALESLTEDERAVINMKIMGDMTFKTIAEVMGQTMGTITWKYQSAIKKLRKFGYE